MANLLRDFGTGAYNTLYEVTTGKPTPGSPRDRDEKRARAIKDRQDKLTIRGLDEQLYSKNEPPPKALTPQQQADMVYNNSLRSVNVTDAQNAANLRLIGAPNLLGAKGQLTQFDIDKADAATRNSMTLMGGSQMDMLNVLSNKELALQRGQGDFADQFIDFAASENDKRRTYASSQFVPDLIKRLLTLGGIVAASRIA